MSHLLTRTFTCCSRADARVAEQVESLVGSVQTW